MDVYEKLANAIILQAVKDYRCVLKRLAKHPDDNIALCTKQEIERFFYSGLFSMFTAIDPKTLIRKIKEDVV